MKVKINYEVNDTEDSIILEADTVEELRIIANREMKRRNAVNYWSEVIEE